jgi:serine protease AprX
MVIKIPNFSQTKGLIIAFVLVFLFKTEYLCGQESIYFYYYRVYFRDKGDNDPSGFSSGELLSERAIKRREKAGIPVPDLMDIPVFRGYIDQVSELGFTFHCASKWMNSALFKTQTPANTNLLLAFPFVLDVKIVKSPTAKKSQFIDKLDFPSVQADSPYDRPITMVNGYPLHSSGFTGKGILIALLDGGFLYTDNASSLVNLRNRNGIKGAYDFVRKNKFVYNYSNHGTAVLSVLAGKIPEVIEGTSQGADYLLLRTEDTGSEFPVEEDFWVAGAEFADSSGADIISSSLGYANFDDHSLDYKYSDMNGNTAFITKAADIAASKGILVVNSAGNERSKKWIRIIAPSDGYAVVAVGAVDANNLISDFSSSGPSADGRVKPDNAAMGVSIPVQNDPNTITRSSGTSFSCPVLSGMSACLMQAVPKALNSDIIKVLHSSADRFEKPDSLYGYGIPDMADALTKLQDFFVKVPEEETFVSPNPTTGDIEINFRSAPEMLIIEIYSASGKVVFNKKYPEYAGRTLRISELQYREQGIYFVRLITGNGTFVNKVIKINN